jgi:hypothetical protein
VAQPGDLHQEVHPDDCRTRIAGDTGTESFTLAVSAALPAGA